jgi:hypothetical protein
MDTKIDSTIKSLIAERNEYIQKHPHLMELQDEIELKMAHLDNPADRLALLGAMMNERLEMLNKNALKLKELLK